MKALLYGKTGKNGVEYRLIVEFGLKKCTQIRGKAFY
jgi:hypothetical protein